MATFMQIGVVPILSRKKKPHIVLVTARGKGRWLLPKGNQHPRRTRREMALTEAYEEAGVVGTIRTKHYIDVPFLNDRRRIVLRLYPMDVERILKKWPEQDGRERIVVDARKANKLLHCKKLCAGVEHLLAVAGA
jgi:hypothetical protein